MGLVVEWPHPRMGVVIPRGSLLIVLEITTGARAPLENEFLGARNCEIDILANFLKSEGASTEIERVWGWLTPNLENLPFRGAKVTVGHCY